MASNAAQQIHAINTSEESITFDYEDMVFDGVVAFGFGGLGGSGASFGNTSEINTAGKQLIKNGLFNTQSWRTYYGTAIRRDGEFVLGALYKSLQKALYVNMTITIKNKIINLL